MMEIVKEATFGSLKSIYSIAIIVIPIMITMQLLKNYKVLDKITKPFGFFAKLFKTSNESVLPLLVGLIFGLAYGAGVIIQTAKEGNLSKRELYLITAFLATCHAVFEDTLIFVAVGANGFIVLGFRVVAAFILTYILSRRIAVDETGSLKNIDLEKVS